MESVKTLKNGILVTESEQTPLVMRVVMRKGGESFVGGGMPMIEQREERFVCVDQLPAELAQRVWTAIEYLSRA